MNPFQQGLYDFEILHISIHYNAETTHLWCSLMVFDVIGDAINHQHINHNIIERATTYTQPNNNNKFLGLLQY